MKAERILRIKEEYEDGAILEIVVWRTPKPVKGSDHHFKYRLFYGYPGRRLIGYDNERGKGDHRHIDEREEAYTFTTDRQLIDDFLNDVKRRRAE